MKRVTCIIRVTFIKEGYLYPSIGLLYSQGLPVFEVPWVTPVSASEGSGGAWRMRPGPPSGPVGVSGPSGTPVWAGPAGPAAPCPAAQGSVR